jgi:hypothetical protein
VFLRVSRFDFVSKISPAALWLVNPRGLRSWFVTT